MERYDEAYDALAEFCTTAGKLLAGALLVYVVIFAAIARGVLKIVSEQ